MQNLSGGIELAGAEKALAAAKKEFVVLQGQANENEMLLKRLAETSGHDKVEHRPAQMSEANGESVPSCR
jgi:hypothetical protein